MSPTTPIPMLSVRGASKSLPNGTPLLEDIYLEIAHGEAVAIVGRSGSGKSTLLSIIGLLDKFDNGAFLLDGHEVASLSRNDLDRSRANSIGFVFQRFALIAHLNVLENVIAPLRHIDGYSRKEMRIKGLAALANVGMESMWRKLPRKLSGGEQQRVAIARALVHSPQLILADEPTGALDQETGGQVVTLLKKRVREQGASLVIVTHDLEIASSMDRTLKVHGHSLLDSQPQVVV